jgi:hypothetical protein
MSKTKITTRRFYNKWLFKATLQIPGVAIFRLFNAKTLATGGWATPTSNPYSTISKALANKDGIMTLSAFLDQYDKGSYGKRIESNSIDLYTNDRQFYDQLVKDFDYWLVHNFEPDPTTAGILENSKSIIVKQLPHHKYHYKVFLLPHKITNKQDKQSFIDWVETQGDRILMSDAVKRWFITTDWNWDRRYVHVQDEQTLLMLKLRGSQLIGQVHDYVIVDK